MGQAPDLRRLVELLKSLFSVDELRRWVHLSFGRRVADELPGAGTGLAQLAFEVAMALERHGLIGERLFEALSQERPGRREEILAVAGGVGVKTNPGTDISPGTGVNPGAGAGMTAGWNTAADASLERVPRIATGSARDAVCRELPKLLASLFDDPMPILLRAGLSREVCQGDSPRNKWTYVCAWLVEQQLWGVVYTLRIVDEVQEERFSHEVSRWAANYIRLLSSQHDGPDGEPNVAHALDDILSFAHRERDRWDEYVRVLKKQAGARTVSKQSMIFITAYRDLWNEFSDALATRILHVKNEQFEPSGVTKAVIEQHEEAGLLLASRGKAG